MKPGDKEYEKLKRSLQEFGYVDPVIWNECTGRVVGGHQRLEVMKEMGVTEVQVSVVDLTDDKEKALNIALNKISGSWDNDKLVCLLRELGDMTELTGFDSEELANLFSNDAEITEDVPPEPPTEPISKPGDLYALGDHRLLCGDATMIGDMEKLLGGELAAMVFTDPPYNVNYGEKAGMLNNYQKGHRNTSSIKNDNMASEAFLEFLTDSFKTIFIGLAPGGPIYVCHAETTGLEFRKAILDTGFMLKQCIIWAKNSMVLGRQDYQWKHEPILYGWKPGAGHKWYGGRKGTTVIEDQAEVVFQKQADHVVINISNGLQSMAIKVPEYEVLPSVGHELSTIWRVDKPTVNDIHPTMKPIALCALAIQNSSKPGDIVLDPFGGSGSTLIACEQTGRRGYSLELDPKYVDVIVTRWENLTGKKAEVIEG